MKVLTTITLQGSHKLLRMGSIRSPAACHGVQVRGRPFLTERQTITDRAITRMGRAQRNPSMAREEVMGIAEFIIGRAFARPQPILRGYASYTIPAATWPRSRSRLCRVLAQASAT